MSRVERVNALLRRIDDETRTAFDEHAQLLQENAKLRKLVKRMRHRLNYKCLCCSISCPDWDKDNDCCVFTTLERGLGIEVK